MVRGTPFVFFPNSVSTCDEFNGDMSLTRNGKGMSMVDCLENIDDEEDFNGEMADFNNKHFLYKEFECFTDEFGEYGEAESYLLPCLKTGVIDFKNDAICDSDYTFIKNCSGKVLKIIDKNGERILLADHEIAVLNHGHRYMKFYYDSEK